MIHNNKVYANADEKFVKNIIVYLKNNELYHDSECTKKLTYDEYVDLFFAGFIMYDVSNNYYAIPYGFNPSMSRFNYMIGGSSSELYLPIEE